MEDIPLFVKINEKLLNQVVTILEQQKNPEATLICGALLEGKIPKVYKAKFGSSGYEEYMEKRIHDAITFYSKAPLHSKIIPLAEFLLWEMKTTCPIPSVQSRLVQYDVTPQGTLTTASLFAKRKCISVPLLNEIGLFSNSQCNLNTQPTVSIEESLRV